jgi:hypothetical protein
VWKHCGWDVDPKNSNQPPFVPCQLAQPSILDNHVFPGGWKGLLQVRVSGYLTAHSWIRLVNGSVEVNTRGLGCAWFVTGIRTLVGTNFQMARKCQAGPCNC